MGDYAANALQSLAYLAYLKGILFSGLLRVAPYCVPGGVEVVSIEAHLLHGCAHSCHAPEARPAPRQVRQHTPIPRPLLALDTEHGPSYRRGDERGVGLGAIRLPFATLRW